MSALSRVDKIAGGEGEAYHTPREFVKRAARYKQWHFKKSGEKRELENLRPVKSNKTKALFARNFISGNCVKTIAGSGESGKVRLILLPEIELQGITFKNTQGIVLPESNECTELFEFL